MEATRTTDGAAAPKLEKERRVPILFLDCGHSGLEPANPTSKNPKPLLERYPTYVETKGKYCDYRTKTKDGYALPIYKGSRCTFHEGGVFFEGVQNRLDGKAIAKRLAPYVEAGLLKIVFTADEIADTSLDERCERANKIWQDAGRPPTLFYSIHYNAISSESKSQPVGVIIFTSPGLTQADEAAVVLLEELKKKMPIWKKGVANPSPSLRLEDTGRLDGDHEANFKVLRGTNMPALLREGGFFTTISEAWEIVYNPAYREALLSGEVAGIAKYLKLPELIV